MLEFDHVRRDISGSLESSASRRRPLREEAQYTEACERPKQHFTRTCDLRSMKTNVIMFPCCHPALNAPCSTEDDTRVPIEAHFTRYLSQSTTALFRRRRCMPFARAIATASRCPTHSYELSSRSSHLHLTESTSADLSWSPLPTSRCDVYMLDVAYGQGRSHPRCLRVRRVCGPW